MRSVSTHLIVIVARDGEAVTATFVLVPDAGVKFLT
jgi:hypothetical protein